MNVKRSLRSPNIKHWTLKRTQTVLLQLEKEETLVLIISIDYCSWHYIVSPSVYRSAKHTWSVLVFRMRCSVFGMAKQYWDCNIVFSHPGWPALLRCKMSPKMQALKHYGVNVHSNEIIIKIVNIYIYILKKRIFVRTFIFVIKSGLTTAKHKITKNIDSDTVVYHVQVYLAWLQNILPSYWFKYMLTVLFLS